MSREILKIIAMITMFIDHYSMVGIAGDNWILFGAIGRLAFPIFAFQVATGFIHTKNQKKYLLTLLGFAILSEIPYNLVRGGIIYPFSQNVIFTFVLSILFIMAINKYCKYPWNTRDDVLKNISIGAMIMFFANMVGFITFVDYFGAGVLMVISFYIILKLKSFNNLNQNIIQNIKYIQIVLIGLTIAVISDSLGGMFVVVNGMEVQIQMFATLSVIPIGVYLLTGEKKLLSGKNSEYFKYFGYLFYPLHLIFLYSIA